MSSLFMLSIVLIKFQWRDLRCGLQQMGLAIETDHFWFLPRRLPHPVDDITTSFHNPRQQHYTSRGEINSMLLLTRPWMSSIFLRRLEIGAPEKSCVINSFYSVLPRNQPILQHKSKLETNFWYWFISQHLRNRLKLSNNYIHIFAKPNFYIDVIWLFYYN